MPEHIEFPERHEDAALEAALAAHGRPGTCPPPQLLFAASEGVLPDPEGENIRAHAQECLLCQTLLVGLAPAEKDLSPGQDARIHSLITSGLKPQQATPQDAASTHSLLRMLLPLAAVLLIALGGVYAYRHLHGDHTGGVARHSPLFPVPPASAGTQPEIAELHTISPLPPPAEAVVTTRGAGNSSQPSTAMLLPAFRLYNHGNYQAAANAFSRLAEKYPEAGIAQLYLGVSQLETNSNAEAQTALARAVDLSPLAQQTAARWYLAVAELRTGHPRNAASLLDRVCADTYAPQAGRACVLKTQIATAPPVKP